MKKNYEIIGNKLVPVDKLDSTIEVYYNPTELEKKFLCENYKIDEHTLASSLDPDEISRIEFEPNHIAFICKRPKNYFGGDQFTFRVLSYGIFLFEEKLVIVNSEEVNIFEGKIFNKITSLNELFLKVIYRSIMHFLEHLKIIGMISDELEQKINSAMENSYLIYLFNLEKSLIYYLNAINANGVLIEKMKLYAQKIGLNKDEIEYIDDMQIDNTQCYRTAEILSNILSGMSDARASIVSNNLNILMKTLNIITIAIMVPTFVVSAFSMNVKIPLQDHYYAFEIIMSLALISVMVFVAIWYYKKW
jgi:magnesium transporter